MLQSHSVNEDFGLAREGREREIRIAIIGLGRQGQEHLAAINNLASSHSLRLTAVCDSNPLALRQVTMKNGVPGFSNPFELLSSDNIDAVVVALPNHLHFNVCAESLARGIHVLKEKPFALTLKQGEALASMSRSKNTVLQVCQQRLFDPLFKQAKAWLPEIGPPKVFDYQFGLPQKKSPDWYGSALLGGGSWNGLGWHGCWALHHFIGQPTAVSMIWDFPDSEVETEQACIMQAQCGNANARVSVNASCHEKIESIYLRGEDGTLVLTRRNLTLYGEAGNIRESANPTKSQRYVDQLELFLRSIEKPAAPQIELDVLKTHTTAIVSAQQDGCSLSPANIAINTPSFP